LYPALYRLEHGGSLKSRWGESENKRRSKYYELTAAGRRRLREETARLARITEAVGNVLDAQPSEV
jgi:DNA-binding PadR family transcriptional regulator